MTFVHLWPEVVAIGRSRSPWQLEGLTVAANEALRAVSRRRAPVDASIVVTTVDAKQRQRVVRELERRLLVFSEERHTDSGAHVKQLEPWSSFCRRHDVQEPLPSVADACHTFEQIVAGWRDRNGARPNLPWDPPRKRGRSAARARAD